MSETCQLKAQRNWARLPVLEVQPLVPLLRSKYSQAISDAIAHLGRPEEIGALFNGFQKY